MTETSRPADTAARVLAEPRAVRRIADVAGAHRPFTVQSGQASFDGTALVHGELDLADALELDAAVAASATAFAFLGSAESLDVRRAKALGEMARRQLAPRPHHRPEHRRVGANLPPSRRTLPRGRPVRWCCTTTSPTPPCVAGTWRGWRTPGRSSPPSRSATGAAPPASPWS